MKNKEVILALGAESAGNFSVFQNGKVHFSQDFGNLADENNFSRFKGELSNIIKKMPTKPTIVLSDLHPLFRTTELAKTLAKKHNAKYVPVQHHLAHIFSSVGDRIIQNSKFKIQNSFIGIACDGTGYSLDEKIWGGEVFSMKTTNKKLQTERVAHLENQILLGGEMAIKEPARLIISILSKLLAKDDVYRYVKKYYSENEFELLWNQLEQNFNCLETSSTARILDAVSVLLGFSKNERLSKHGPVELLEKNSTSPHILKPVVEFDESEKMWILKTTPLFEFLIKNINKNKKRLAATAQSYLAEGLIEIIRNTKYEIRNTYFAGGMANNKIMSSILESQGIYTNKKIPRGDAGISFGQIFFYLFSK
jgi:hydrogenase maturation protein HypF